MMQGLTGRRAFRQQHPAPFALVRILRRAVIIQVKYPPAAHPHAEEESPHAPGAFGGSPRGVLWSHVIRHPAPALVAVPFRQHLLHPVGFPVPGEPVRAGRRFFQGRGRIKNDLDQLVDKMQLMTFHNKMIAHGDWTRYDIISAGNPNGKAKIR